MPPPSNRRSAELSAAYVRLVLQSGVASIGQLLRGSGISQPTLAEREFVDAADLAVVFRNYDRCIADRAWTAHLGAQLNVASHGPLGFAALSAPTLGEALDVMATLYPSRNTAMTATTQITATHFAFQAQGTTGEPDLDQWLVEVVLKVMEGLLGAVLGHPVGKNVLISFQHDAPKDSDRLIASFHSNVEFGSTHSAIAVPLAWRLLPSPLYDEPVYRANLIKCREQIAAREQTGSIAHAVKNSLCIHFDALLLDDSSARQPPTMEQIADAMHLTPRTLIRKLQREETAYKEILQNLRQEYAQRLLQDARLTVADVAELLGYREAANFGRAFRRWFGTSPAAWRRR